MGLTPPVRASNGRRCVNGHRYAGVPGCFHVEAFSLAFQFYVASANPLNRPEKNNKKKLGAECNVIRHWYAAAKRPAK
jgi:hypothetical protein